MFQMLMNACIHLFTNVELMKSVLISEGPGHVNHVISCCLMADAGPAFHRWGVSPINVRTMEPVDGMGYASVHLGSLELSVKIILNFLNLAFPIHVLMVEHAYKRAAKSFADVGIIGLGDFVRLV